MAACGFGDVGDCEERMAKISKEAAGYVEFERSNSQCQECYKFNPDRQQQACAEVGGKIQPYGGCNTFVKGDISQIGPIRLPRKLLKEEAGYMENKAGFNCKRCEHFDREKWLCEKVEGEVRPFGCCNLWEKSLVMGEIA